MLTEESTDWWPRRAYARRGHQSVSAGQPQYAASSPMMRYGQSA